MYLASVSVLSSDENTISAASMPPSPATATPGPPTPYRSFWMAGFEGADHRNAHGTPLDLVQANGHLDHVDDDYGRVATLGLASVRESIGYGRPADVDIFANNFASRFADFAGAAARALRGSSDDAPVYTPINEISFLAWAISETKLIHPYRRETYRRRGEGGQRHDVGWEAKWRLVRFRLTRLRLVRRNAAPINAHT